MESDCRSCGSAQKGKFLRESYSMVAVWHGVNVASGLDKIIFKEST